MWVCLTGDRGPTQVGFESVQTSLGWAHGFVNKMSKKKASQPWIEDVDFAGKVCDETGSHQKKKGSVAGVASKIKKTLTTEGSS